MILGMSVGSHTVLSCVSIEGMVDDIWETINFHEITLSAILTH